MRIFPGPKSSIRREPSVHGEGMNVIEFLQEQQPLEFLTNPHDNKQINYTCNGCKTMMRNKEIILKKLSQNTLTF